MVGDITTMQTEAIVNAANSGLLGGGGVDGAIHRRGGAEIIEACKVIRATSYPQGLPVGKAVITGGGKLKAKYVIHTVGPRYASDPDPQAHLQACYTNALLLADEYQCRSISFPAISAGIYGYPMEEASVIAYETVCRELDNCNHIKEVFFVFFSQQKAELFKEVNGIGD